MFHFTLNIQVRKNTGKILFRVLTELFEVMFFYAFNLFCFYIFRPFSFLFVCCGYQLLHESTTGTALANLGDNRPGRPDPHPHDN